MATRLHAGEGIAVRAFRAEDLTRLLAAQPNPCVSLYLPTHRKHPEWKQDPVRFRALVSRAEALLAERSAPADIERVLGPVRALEREPHWEYSLDGLAVFSSPAFSAAYRIPSAVTERVVVADTFHVKPLVRFLHTNRRYYALALSQNAVTLYEGSPFGAGAVDLAAMPQNLRDAIGSPDADRALSRHGGAAAPVFHGRGPGREETKEVLLKYFRAIDRGLRDYLHDERAPLILASVAYYHPIYREANTYAHLLPEGVDGSFERANGEQIHQAAWPLVRSRFEHQAGDWANRYRALAGTGLASDRMEEIAPAAVSGRVRCLLAEEGATVWGTLDRTTGALTRTEKQDGAECDDLVDDLCEESLKRGAEVFVVARGVMPTESPTAAIFRF